MFFLLQKKIFIPVIPAYMLANWTETQQYHCNPFSFAFLSLVLLEIYSPKKTSPMSLIT